MPNTQTTFCLHRFHRCPYLASSDWSFETPTHQGCQIFSEVMAPTTCEK